VGRFVIELLADFLADLSPLLRRSLTGSGSTISSTTGRLSGRRGVLGLRGAGFCALAGGTSAWGSAAGAISSTPANKSWS